MHFERCCWEVKKVEGFEDEGVEMGGLRVGE